MDSAGDAAGRQAQNLFGWLTSPLAAGLIVLLGTSWWTCDGFAFAPDNGWRLSTTDPAFGASGALGGLAPACERVIPVIGNEGSAWMVAVLVAALGYVIVWIVLEFRRRDRAQS